MRRLLLLCLIPCAHAAPFVTSDPVDTGTTSCGVFMDAAPKVVVPVAIVGGVKVCQYDLATLSSGSHTIQMTAIIAATATNTGGESAKSLPLAFIKQVAPAAPAGLGLSP